MNIAIIFAGGVGKRMSNNAIPKQFMKVNDVPIIIHTLNIFQAHPNIDKIYISILPSHRKELNMLLQQYGISKVAGLADGGATGQDSIYNALKLALSENPADSTVLIHDGVRPIVTDSVITRNIQAVAEYGSAITCVPCTETIIVTPDKQEVKEILPREELGKAQAPQSFVLSAIVAAHEKLRATETKYGNMVDSCSVYNTIYGSVHLVQGNYGNIKVTTPEDVYILKGLLQYRDATQAFGIED